MSMTDDDKALVERLRDFVIAEDIDLAADRIEALSAENERLRDIIGRFIIAKPDPLVEALKDMDFTTDWDAEDAKHLRAALAKRGLEIREKSE